MGRWWLEELGSDRAYEEVVSPLLISLLPERTGLFLDMGAGEGRVMRRLGERGLEVVGVDVDPDLARMAGNAVVADIPPLPFAASSFDGAFAVLLLEHIADHTRLFRESARVVRPQGALVVVVNHPVWTAPGSTPITDVDGETLWRPGSYFEAGWSEMPAGGGRVRFYHRPMGELLSAAAGAGWSLEKLIEEPHHEIPGQEGIPRLLACRWRLLP